MGRKDRGLVLLAEDDRAQREMLEEVLAHEGYRVLPADNPTQVLNQLLLGPDAVLLDLVGVASPARMRVLAALPRRPGLVLVSADTALPRIAEQVGAEAYVTKPYALEVLLQELARVIEMRTHAPAHLAEMGWANAL
jgi:CheY-like chemotaxis protein